ncbi:chain-length determining protein [Rheinheimera maricola]|uniref:Chain-length determining protein n=1 Tax=Rheinheimera maricola TaxID=2793282 RepID=A0ABS7X6G2_9GAMM|nr:chain-length determining protein [Rheinheimera maricola]MBZ9610303.1 chain-length determining protein [Rheinheimera maricola]
MREKLTAKAHWLAAGIACICAVFYWSVLATDRYISETNIVLESPELAPSSFNFTSLLSGTGGSADLLLLKDHLLSVDMLKKIDASLQLRQHYSSSDIDWLSRLDADAAIEHFHEYYQKRIHVVFDDYAGLLRIRVAAYSPEQAKAIADALLQEGEAHMNDMGRRLAEEQVRFIEGQVAILNQRLEQAREELLSYQNQYGLVSPTAAVESIAAIVARLESQLALTEAQRKAAMSYQSAVSPELKRLNAEIDALKQQIALEQNRLAAGDGQSLNRVSAEYETIALRAKFALELYSNTLIALENTRIEASRKLKQVSVLQYPTLPEYAVEPKRMKNSIVFIVMTLLLAGIVHLLLLIIRDHRD